MMGLLNRFTSFFNNDMAIDLGTANTLIHIRGLGIVLNEPSMVALFRESCGKKRVLAVGREAKTMQGRTPKHIQVIRPMKDGVIADFQVVQIMLRHFIRKVSQRWRLMKPRIVVAVPSGITAIEMQAVREAALASGAREVHLIEEPMAAALGADLPVSQPLSSMVVDIGGGTTEVGIISLSGIASGFSLRTAGDEMDTAISQYIRNHYHMLIGIQTAEVIKMRLADAFPQTRKRMEIRGRDLETGKPKILKMSSEEACYAISDPLFAILNSIRDVLENTPPELSGDIVETGILLTGGVALLHNLDTFVTEHTGVAARVAPYPLLSVALGSGKALENQSLLMQIRMNQTDAQRRNTYATGIALSSVPC